MTVKHTTIPTANASIDSPGARLSASGWQTRRRNGGSSFNCINPTPTIIFVNQSEMSVRLVLGCCRNGLRRVPRGLSLSASGPFCSSLGIPKRKPSAAPSDREAKAHSSGVATRTCSPLVQDDNDQGQDRKARKEPDGRGNIIDRRLARRRRVVLHCFCHGRARCFLDIRRPVRLVGPVYPLIRPVKSRDLPGAAGAGS